MTPEIASSPAHLFPIAPATAYEPLPGWVDSNGSTGIYRGANPPVGAVIDVFVRAFTGESISISVKGPDGRTVANLSAPGTPGFTRITWDLYPSSELLTAYGGEGRKFVKPGEYEVTMTYGDTTGKQKITVSALPDVETR